MSTPEALETVGRPDWRNFWRVVSEPWTVGLLLATLTLFAVSQRKLPAEANTLVQVLLAVCSGVLGGRIANRISSLTEESVLLARGKVAVRGLKLLLGTAAALETRTKQFLADEDEIRGNPRTTTRNYQEVIAQCRLLQEEAVSSIENWTDIVSEAKVVTQIGRITALAAQLEDKERQLEELQQTLSSLQLEDIRLSKEEEAEMTANLKKAREEIRQYLENSGQTTIHFMPSRKRS